MENQKIGNKWNIQRYIILLNTGWQALLVGLKTGGMIECTSSKLCPTSDS